MIEDAVSFRSLKVASVIKRALGELFMGECHDLGCLVSVSDVRVSEDAKNATVLVVVRKGCLNEDEVVSSLNDASEGIRRSIFKYLRLRYVPRLYFKLDVGFGDFLRVAEVLASRSEI